MTKALFRDSLRAIRKTFARFISIVIIVALGVGFYAGIKAVSPNMKQAAQDLFDELHLADVAVQSTVGFDEHDRAAVLALPGVEKVTLSRSIDGILYDPRDPEVPESTETMAQGMTGTAYVTRVIGYDFNGGGDRLNQLKLVVDKQGRGRWPQAPNECVVSVYENQNDRQHYSLGQYIKIKGDHADILDSVEHEVYQVVGMVYTPEFVSMELGPSEAGGGELSGYVYIPDSAFKFDYYTTMYVGMEDAAKYGPYEEDYYKAVRGVVETLEAEGREIVKQRVTRLEDTFLPQIEQGKRDLEQGRIDGEARLAKAREDRDKLKKAVEEGPELLKQARLDGERELEAGRKKALNGEAEYNKKLAEYSKSKAKYDAALAEVNKNPHAREEYEAGLNQYEQAKNSYDIANLAVRAGREALRVCKQALDSGDPQRLENALKIASGYLPMSDEDKTVEGMTARVEEMDAQLSEQEAALADAKKDLDAAKKKLDNAKSQMAELDEFDKASTQLLAAEAKLHAAEAEIESAPKKLEDGVHRLEFRLKEEEEKLAAAISRAQTVDEEYEKGVEEYNEQIADAERKIRIAENQMAAAPNAQWIISDRDYYPGYTNYGDTADSMELFAVILPAVFLIVAALVSFTTMTRMVEDERTQMGVLKAQGYSGGAIAFKYLFYAFTAGLLGTVLGVAGLGLILPQAMFTAYQILYLIPSMRPMFFAGTALSCLGLAMLSTVGAASFSVMRAMRYRPAELMRPKAPKAGKRVFLQRFPFIWNHLGFNGKVTVRNLMRNKSRFFMTFFGVMACTALLLTGFGIGNSIGTMLDKQFGAEGIMPFDSQALLQAPMRAGEDEVLDVFRKHSDRIDNMLPAYVMQMYAGTEAFGRQIPIRLAVPEDVSKIDDFIKLTDDKTGKHIMVSNQGCFINGKTAALMGLKVGDKITIQNGKKHADITVAGITHNYIYHWIYMTPRVYEEAFHEECTFNVVLMKLNPALSNFKGSKADQAEVMNARAQLTRDLSDTAEVITVIYNKTLVDSVGKMLGVMANVVMSVVVLASGALALVVLYTLNIINIYERVRELATIKVLGFHDKEADMFVYRENIIISVLGLVAGLGAGIPFFGMIIRAAEIESMMFVRTLAPANYIAAALVTVVFTVGVNLLMHKKIKDISMVESLKSVE